MTEHSIPIAGSEKLNNVITYNRGKQNNDIRVYGIQYVSMCSLLMSCCVRKDDSTFSWRVKISLIRNLSVAYIVVKRCYLSTWPWSWLLNKCRAIAGRTARCRCISFGIYVITLSIEFYDSIVRFFCHSTAFLSVTIQMPKLHTVQWFSRPWCKITAIADKMPCYRREDRAMPL